MTSDEISLREYFEARWKAHNKEHEMLQAAIDRAVAELNRRLEEMNQFRAQIQEERSEFIPKSEYESRHRELLNKMDAGFDSLDKRVKLIELAKSNMDGRVVVVLGGITVLINLAFHFWPK